MISLQDKELLAVIYNVYKNIGKLIRKINKIHIELGSNITYETRYAPMHLNDSVNRFRSWKHNGLGEKSLTSSINYLERVYAEINASIVHLEKLKKFDYYRELVRDIDFIIEKLDSFRIALKLELDI